MKTIFLKNNFVSQNIISLVFHIRKRFWQELWNSAELKEKQTFHRKHIWHHWFLFMLDTCCNYNSDCFFSRGTTHNSCSQSQGDRMICCKQLKGMKSSIISVDPLVYQFLSLHWADINLKELSWGENPIFFPSCGTGILSSTFLWVLDPSSYLRNHF